MKRRQTPEQRVDASWARLQAKTAAESLMRRAEALHLTADLYGNVVATVTMTTPDAFTRVEPMDGGVVLLELGADESVQLQIVAPAEVLRAVLAQAVERLR